MLKAIFFDWYNTVVHYSPFPEDVLSRIYPEFNIRLSTLEIRRGIFAADQYFYEEHSRLRFEKRSREEQVRMFIRYQMTVLEANGLNIPYETAALILKKNEEAAKKSRMVLFEDVIPTLELLKKRHFILGMISNVNKSIDSILTDLKLNNYLDLVVTSMEAGADKPRPEIFNYALKKAGAGAAEAMHIGDQYIIDVVGARNAGIRPVLLDRFDMQDKNTGCDKIRSLNDLDKII